MSSMRRNLHMHLNAGGDRRAGYMARWTAIEWDAPSRSMSYSCAILRMSSPSLASTVLSRLPLESLKWTLILGRNAGEG